MILWRQEKLLLVEKVYYYVHIVSVINDEYDLAVDSFCDKVSIWNKISFSIYYISNIVSL